MNALTDPLAALNVSPAISFSGVSKQYLPSGGGHAVAALKDIDLQIRTGAILGIAGASGAGKTTFLDLITARTLPTSGNIAVGASKASFVPQTIDLRAARTVLENILLPLDNHNLPQWQGTSRARNLLERLGLTDIETRFPRELSAGERQKVAIVRALVTEPDLLLLDEPFSVLDQESTAEVVTLLDEINRSNGTTIAVASRSPATLKDLAHDLVVLERGRIAEQGPAFDVLTQPSSEATRALVGSAFSASLPDFLRTRLTAEPCRNGQAIVRLTFVGEAATTPVITRLARDLGLDANILLGSAETVRGRLYGVLIVGVASGEPYLTAALDHFAEAGLRTDVIGYLEG
ncbi:methionine import ATP-binding protein MetN [Agaricicola taiwanensis]|uniref:Methionine import ATP-binding protein MetN n=1 Tax=Agaricicola taiwanensis TaxID=591372 RepID=A0A8J2YCP7_9RHOB|nr:ATP-binding cassette domain-containing protein [Agaricicola taiwanensis]GGE37726.1 methionine import ATP-binding protein MetN [Agaricicola taiwanensis]